MSNFPQLPWFPRRHIPQPELFPAPAVGGSFIVSGGTGHVSAAGSGASINAGRTFSAAPGQGQWTGAQGGLQLGQGAGFTAGPGNVLGFGFPGSVTIGATPPPIIIPVNVAPFTPALSELGMDIFERVGIRAGEISPDHASSLRRSMNFALVRFANNGINLWSVAAKTITLLPGVATYTLPTNLIDWLDAYVTTNPGLATANDIIITPMSRNTYSALPVKSQPGRPILTWFNRQIIPTVTTWPVADVAGLYTLTYYGFYQTGDADASMGNTLGLPYRFLEAFPAVAAAHLAMKLAPERAVALKAYANEAFTEAADRDIEKVTLSVSPDLGAYFL